MADEPVKIKLGEMSLQHTTGPNTFLARNVFEQAAGGGFPVKLNGKTIGTGKLSVNGGVELDIFDEEAKILLTGGSVSGLSVDYTSKTIEAIMNNRKKKGL